MTVSVTTVNIYGRNGFDQFTSLNRVTTTGRKGVAANRGQQLGNDTCVLAGYLHNVSVLGKDALNQR